ncbi:MAG: glutamine--tRNA ligase/YqeY domain fusion protein [Opitutae bacterium]|nr:glutamine--tRNA ligase/YqeY domain fusion protein [Opitutae bacterium]
MSQEDKPLHFIRQIISDDVSEGKNEGKVLTRFPPEPNGYLHIGHAKSICLNFGVAKEFGGLTNLRFDDTNPDTENVEYVKSIQEDVKWLGFEWNGEPLFASQYFDKMHQFSIELIKQGKAYVCDLSMDELRAYRGTPTEPGRESPYMGRSIDENIDLFQRMKNGEFPDGSKTLRARIDMASPNMHMRDPALYRIKHSNHYRTGNDWCIYPMYDYAHCLEDSIECITHSICTLEFEVHRPLYDWVLESLDVFPSRQYEFARLNLGYTVMSKRKLLQLAEEGHVSGWDDPRMPTISGLRRRGYTPESIRNFCEVIGVTKFNSLTDIALLEHCVRDHLNKVTHRTMAVLDPIKVVITNYPEGQVEGLDAVNNPEDESAGTRKVPFTRELYIERSDFMEDPPRKFFRLGIGREVRFRWAYFLTCHDVVKDAEGEIIEIHCTYDPLTKGGDAPDGRKVKGTIHWVSAEKSITAEVRLYDRLFTVEKPDAGKDKDFKEFLNPDSLQVIEARIEPHLAKVAEPGYRCQFERTGYFCADPDSSPSKLVFNRTVPLRDSWGKVKNK